MHRRLRQSVGVAHCVLLRLCHAGDSAEWAASTAALGSQRRGGRRTADSAASLSWRRPLWCGWAHLLTVSFRSPCLCLRGSARRRPSREEASHGATSTGRAAQLQGTTATERWRRRAERRLKGGSDEETKAAADGSEPWVSCVWAAAESRQPLTFESAREQHRCSPNVEARRAGRRVCRLGLSLSSTAHMTSHCYTTEASGQYRAVIASTCPVLLRYSLVQSLFRQPRAMCPSDAAMRVVHRRSLSCTGAGGGCGIGV